MFLTVKDQDLIKGLELQKTSAEWVAEKFQFSEVQTPCTIDMQASEESGFYEG